MKKKDILDILYALTDPEIPVLTLHDMGVIKDVHVEENGAVEVVITPTYTGCPAMDFIEANIKSALQEAGAESVSVRTVLSPAWTTDWMKEEAKLKLKEYGIAPPIGPAEKFSMMENEAEIPCPLCGSVNTVLVSQFGSTACKSLHKCVDCLEPFDYFKCH